MDIHETIKRFMLQNDFSISFYNNLIKHLYAPISDIDDFNLIFKEKMKSKILIEDKINENNLIMIIGPVGEGKTTTILKLAFNYVKMKKKRVHLVSLESHCLGADLQMKRYAEISGCNFHLMRDSSDLKMVLNSIPENETVFIDTPGESLAKKKELSRIIELSKCFPKKPLTFFAISANMKYSNLLAEIEKFNCLSYDYFIVTKMDETKTIGPVVEALYNSLCPVAYIAMGQEVDGGIKVPVINSLLDFIH